MEKKILTAVVVGCGDRALVYVHEAVDNLGLMKIVACVDPSAEKRKMMHEKYGVSEDRCFANQDELMKLGRIADCVINGTMDKYHIATAIPLLEQGYDMLLEKPIANNVRDLLNIRDTALAHNCNLVICHVLRFSSFYKKVKEIIDSGILGEIVNMETSEHVGYAHASMAYIRGKWNNESVCGSPLLLAKCSHDIDLLCWFNNKTQPEEVMSYGSRDFILPAKAPKGAGTRCMVDCPDEVRAKCPYEAEAMYIKNCMLPYYCWISTGIDYRVITEEQKIESLKTTNPHGACAYKIESDLVDHQVVQIKFANGSTATHALLLGCARAERTVTITGTMGELRGKPGEKLTLSVYDPKTSTWTETDVFGNPGDELEFSWYDKEADKWHHDLISKVPFEQDAIGSAHFGGDAGLVTDFCSLIIGGKTSTSTTSITDSVAGHLAVFAAEKARKSGKPVKISEISAK